MVPTSPVTVKIQRTVPNGKKNIPNPLTIVCISSPTSGSMAVTFGGLWIRTAGYLLMTMQNIVETTCKWSMFN